MPSSRSPANPPDGNFQPGGVHYDNMGQVKPQLGGSTAWKVDHSLVGCTWCEVSSGAAMVQGHGLPAELEAQLGAPLMGPDSQVSACFGVCKPNSELCRCHETWRSAVW